MLIGGQYKELTLSKGKQRKASSKVSLVKLSNKRLNKLAKQGKLKRKVPKSELLRLIKERVQTKETSTPQETNEEQETNTNHCHYHDEVQEDKLEKADYDYYGAKQAENLSFLVNLESTEKLSRKRKKKLDRETSDALERRYEKKASLSQGEVSQKVMKALLPIKTKEKGIETRMIEETHPEEDADNEEPDLSKTVEEEKPLPALSTAELFARRQQKLVEIKHRIATLASAIIENPYENIKKLKELRLLLETSDPDVMVTCKKLCIVSLMEVFKDIIPQYTIRLATDKERQQSASKETKSLRDFEESLLQNYRNYLEILEALAKGKKLKTKDKKKDLHERLNGVEIPVESARNLKELSVKCLLELLVTHPHFNYRANIIAVAVPYIADKKDTVSTMICGYVKRIFKEDNTGEVTLEVVRCISKKVKSLHFKVHPKVLNTFLSLKIKEIDRGGEGTDNKKTAKQDRKSMSRRDRKRKKQMKELEKELEDAAAVQNKKHKLKLHTETINHVFLTYFRVLKQARHSVLLSAVLEGIAKFAHLINVEFFDDLFSVLNELVESGDLSYRECLHCIKTAFIILSGQGSSLNIDPLHFYKHLYATLYQLSVGITSEDVGTALECLDIMITKRKKQISLQRLTGFIKRLTTLSLQLSADGAIGALASTRNFLLADSKTDILLDTEHEGTGMYLPELNDPEHVNAHNTALYELYLTKRHYHPVLRSYSNHLLSGCSTNIASVIPLAARKSAADLYEVYNQKDLNFNPPIQEKPNTFRKLYIQDGFLQTELKNDAIRLKDQYADINIEKLLFHKGLSSTSHVQNGKVKVKRTKEVITSHG